MTLIGVLDTMGGFYTIRGFAKLADIAKISKPEAYQRQLIEKHKEEIEGFYRNGKWLFFPELVLGHVLKYDFRQEDARSGINPHRDITIEHKPFISNVEKIKYTPYRTSSGNQRLYKIQIDDRWLDQGNQPFARIDGNHRIEAYRALMEDGKLTELEEYRAPFSLILFPDNDENKRNQKAIFHNINAKARPLTTEEELKGIIVEGGFDEEELTHYFGGTYVIVHRAYEMIATGLERAFPFIGRTFKDEPITILKQVVDMLASQQTPLAKTIEASLQNLNLIFGTFQQALSQPTKEVIIVALYIDIINNSQTKLFIKWVIQNHINELEDVDPLSLLNIYEKVRESKKRQIFVSMQFDEASRSKYEAIQKAVDEINHEYNLEIKIREIRIDEFNQGHSYKIDDAILKLIEESGLLIADLSSKNINVYQELGYLMGLNHGKDHIQENFILILEQSETTQDSDVGFNIRSYQQLRFTGELDLVDKLKDSIKIYYNLGESS